MHRTSLQLLDDILEAIKNIEEDTGGITFEEFSADRRRRDAVIRNIQVIGEAIKNLPPELRERYPDTEWKNIAGFRDVLTHVYFGKKEGQKHTSPHLTPQMTLPDSQKKPGKVIGLS